MTFVWLLLSPTQNARQALIFAVDNDRLIGVIVHSKTAAFGVMSTCMCEPETRARAIVSVIRSALPDDASTPNIHLSATDAACVALWTERYDNAHSSPEWERIVRSMPATWLHWRVFGQRDGSVMHLMLFSCTQGVGSVFIVSDAASYDDALGQLPAMHRVELLPERDAHLARLRGPPARCVRLWPGANDVLIETAYFLQRVTHAVFPGTADVN